MSDWFEDYGWGEVADDLLIGAYPQDAADVAVLDDEAVTRVLNLVEDREYEAGRRAECAAALTAAGIAESRIMLEDYGRLGHEQLEQAVALVLDWLESGERVYVHCRAGWQRSASVAAAVIAVRESVSLLEGLSRVQQQRPEAEPLIHQREDLATWWMRRRSGVE